MQGSGSGDSATVNSLDTMGHENWVLDTQTGAPKCGEIWFYDGFYDGMQVELY